MPDPSAVITNTSPLLYLHQVGYLNILQQLYRTVLIPPAVKQELETGRRKGFDVPDINSLVRIQVRPVASAVLVPAVVDLGQGEAEVLALGLEIPESLLILDDQLARCIAGLHALRYTGTLGVLVKTKQEGHLSSVGAVITALREKSMWLSDTIVEETLRLSGE
jgi:predicted nucleic acid-binding protein